MLTVLSPAKSLDFESATLANVAKLATQPQFIAQAKQLNKLLRKLDVPQLAQLMSISDKLATLNVARNAEWSETFTLDNAKPAILAFNGDVYDGFDAKSMSLADLKQAQARLAIDDAVGEAFDKGATVLGLPFPGGPHLDRLASTPEANDRAERFPISRVEDGSGGVSLNFSFSGLCTLWK